MQGDGASDVVVRVLGELEIRHGGAGVPVGHTRQRAVLAVLAMEAGQVVPIDLLLDRVWGERAPARQRSVLRTYLSRLRPLLAPTGITITRQGLGYLLAAEPGIVDAHRFQRLLDSARRQPDPRAALELAEEALALWRGEPLAELDTPWALEVRERLRLERAAAVADRIDWALECGRHRELLAELATSAAAQPLDERTAAQLMLALYRAGRQADALRHYQRTRDRLIDELGTEPGPALRELHQRVLTADPALAVPPSTRARLPAVPRQLPAPPRTFYGRDTELAQLEKILTDGGERDTMVVSAVCGAGGVGKTWLILHWAHRAIDRFPDGQLYVDLRGFDPVAEPVPVAAALRHLLDGLGVSPGEIPGETAARTALYRSLLAGRRMLVVLDNARDAAQVVPLLPGSPACTVLVTSRDRLPALTTRHGARSLVLTTLPDTDSHGLLASRLGSERVATEPGAVSALVRHCAGLPLALSIVAARADAHPGFPLASLVDELDEAPSSLDVLDTGELTAGLRAVFAASSQALPPEAAAVFTLLGLMPAPEPGLDALAALTSLPASRVRVLLQTLETASLVQQHRPRRYRMHDLIRLHTTELAHRELSEKDRETALRRLIDFYLHTSHTADRLLYAHDDPIDIGQPCAGARPLSPRNEAEALTWFDTEHDCLMALQRMAVAQGRHATVWRLAWVLDTFHRRQGNLDDQLALWRAGASAAAETGDQAARCLALWRLGAARSLTGRDHEGVDLLGRALTLAEQTGDRGRQANIHQNLATAWELRGDDRRALHHAREALAILEPAGRPIRLAHALNQVGWYATRTGRHDEARTRCEAALDLFRRHENPDGEARTLDSLGYLEHRSGRHTTAVEHYRRAVTLFRELGCNYDEADTLERLGDTCLALGDRDQAEHCWHRTLELYHAQNRPREEEALRARIGAARGQG
ncbi:hypothetical protein GCM10027598_85580 [Amycolatopsis oliviviridis]|uniref:OmpR/PhoB-type domain-containing protein n=1 Tax=Amycolatopsis oliviviridis TaxID=1471590 RepID=A0ABQ3MD59_9PSEU|nr:BTAD domain-containing putative transcriptional regulator [Amycolatopsis oliviviridis]GHH38999.1 hypothetical protein GCM10017790_85450 [Amycolatopsis oliviviridis]